MMQGNMNIKFTSQPATTRLLNGQTVLQKILCDFNIYHIYEQHMGRFCDLVFVNITWIAVR